MQEFKSPPVNESMVVGIDQNGTAIQLPKEAFQRAGQTGVLLEACDHIMSLQGVGLASLTPTPLSEKGRQLTHKCIMQVITLQS